MTEKEVKAICKQYLPNCKDYHLPLNLDDLLVIAKKAVQKAKTNYAKIKPPKIADLDTHITSFIRDDLVTAMTAKMPPARKIEDNSKDPFEAALNRYVKTIPLGSLDKLHKLIYENFKKEGEKATEKLFLPKIKKLTDTYPILSRSRNQIVKKQGFKDYTQMRKKRFRIPSKDFQIFIKNYKKVIKYCQQNLSQNINPLPDWFYSQLHIPCHVCPLKQFPTLSDLQIIDFVAGEYPILKKFKHKIKINKKDNGSSIRYQKENDTFVIGVHKITVNYRHRVLILIHELSHAVAYLKKFSQNKNPFNQGSYFNEKQANEIEIKLLKKLGKDIYGASLIPVLNLLHQVIFEIEVYKNPNQDLPRLYAKIYNLCYPQAKQTKNYRYLINEEIMFQPLTALPHAVSWVNVLSKKTIP